MLTPVEIQSKSFKSGGLGYDKKDVDGFMREILRSYEDLYRENVEQKDRLSALNDSLQAYKAMEKTLQNALVLAEKTAEERRQLAQKEAKRIEKEARTSANIMLADARNELEHLHQQTIGLLQQYEKYKAQFRNLAAAQMEMLETDAFQINVARLDAFIDVAPAERKPQPAPEMNQQVRETKEQVQPEYDEEEVEESEYDFEENLRAEAAAAYEDREAYEERTSYGAGAAYENEEDGDEYSQMDFANFDIEGQEEFDFYDLNDAES